MRKLWEKILRAFVYLSALGVAVMVVTVVYDTLMRYFFDRPTKWSLDLNGYLVVLITFTPLGWVLAVKRHITLDAIQELMGGVKKTIMEIVAYIAAAAYLAVLVWLSWSEAWGALIEGQKFEGIIYFPKAPVLFIIPVSVFLLEIEFIYQILQRIKLVKRKTRRKISQ